MSEGMSPRAALGAAFGDLYRQSWRLFVLNACLSAVVVPIVVAGLWVPPIWILLVAAGPLALALMHCAVVVTRTDELRLHDALDGLRLHWRRGLVLGAFLALGGVAGVYAISSYAARGALVLAVLGVYLLVVFGIFQLVLWPLAVDERNVPIKRVAAEAGRTLLTRPMQSIVFGLALLVVNAVGLAAAVMPFLTITIAYSFLAAARFTLPPTSTPEVPDRWPA
jgi:hypothetical protein